MSSYADFLNQKAQLRTACGFEAGELPKFLFPFQEHLVRWALRQGRAAIFADCGLGKTPMQLVWADQVVKRTNKPVLILSPLAVSSQTVREADKFGIDAVQSREGKFEGTRAIVTNYERLHYFDPSDFGGVVCDESSILKNFNGETRKRLTRFMAKMPFRLLCTATAAPNDYIELGTSSEALGELTHTDMLKRFFKYLDDKGQKSESQQQAAAESAIAANSQYYQKLAYRVAQTIGQWRLKHHAVVPFWRWVASWATACRHPKDIGFDDDRFVLPPLNQIDHIIKPSTPPDGMLFNVPAFGLGAERDERRRTIDDRCGFVSQLVHHDRPAVVWCQMNAEGDLLEKLIPDAKQVSGKTPDDEKVEIYDAFAAGTVRVLIIKPKIGAWGLNWQHCNHVVTFATHSYEQFYQSVRRCWRFGQARPVRLDVIATEGEARVIANMSRKADRAEKMFEALVREMNGATKIVQDNPYTNTTEIPSWLPSKASSKKTTRRTAATASR